MHFKLEVALFFVDIILIELNIDVKEVHDGKQNIIQIKKFYNYTNIKFILQSDFVLVLE